MCKELQRNGITMPVFGILDELLIKYSNNSMKNHSSYISVINNAVLNQDSMKLEECLINNFAQKVNQKLLMHYQGALLKAVRSKLRKQNQEITDFVYSSKR